ncbi:MAG: HAD hydrolase family protein, partial [Bacteroidaceae bacterium]|nr:HAD hydrolase family protein [Bacteroidaceae bacterium]
KDAGIDHIIWHYGIDLSETVGIGDGGNDIPMLRHAALGIAMDNASDVVKSHANYITTHVDDNGIYNALRHFHII